EPLETATSPGTGPRPHGASSLRRTDCGRTRSRSTIPRGTARSGRCPATPSECSPRSCTSVTDAAGSCRLPRTPWTSCSPSPPTTPRRTPMCRGNDHGGRRCPADTSDARRARRYASAASSRSETLTASSVRSAPPPAPAVDERPEVEKLTEEAEALRSAIRSCEQVGRQSTEILSGLRNVYRGDGDKALSEFTRLLGEKLEAEGVDPRFYGPGEGHLFDTETGNFRWTVAEQKVVELGARTDAWLDGELLDDAQAVADAQAAESAAEAVHKAVGDEIRGAQESHPARF